MSDFAQTKTPQGYLPFKAVRRGPRADKNNENSYNELAFELYTPTELAEHPEATASTHDTRHADLVKLAACMQLDGDGVHFNRDNALELAQSSGPLFGSSAVESIRDWGFAATPALVALRIQEYLNGSCEIGKVAGLGQIGKLRIVAEQADSAFTLYSFGFPVAGAYAGVVRQFPIIRRIGSSSGYYYAFVTKNEGSPVGEFVASVDILAFEDELTAADFAALCRCLDLDDSSQKVAREQLGIDTAESSRYHIATDLAVTAQEAELDSTDRGALVAFVQTLVICHLSAAHVDVFQGSDETGFLSFENYLSWLWFDFSRKLDTVKIGYCKACGRPFSLAGHRGIAKVFCSEKCKTAAKNAKEKERCARARNMFLNEGAGVGEIARRLDVPEQKVRRQLATWAELKHALDDDIEAHGFAGSALLTRCQTEGLDPANTLLNARRKRELKELGGQSRRG